MAKVRREQKEAKEQYEANLERKNVEIKALKETLAAPKKKSIVSNAGASPWDHSSFVCVGLATYERVFTWRDSYIILLLMDYGKTPRGGSFAVLSVLSDTSRLETFIPWDGGGGEGFSCTHDIACRSR